MIGRGLSDVSIHYLSGMIQAVEHLRQLKHQKIAYIGGSAGLTISDHHEQAFVKAVEKAGLKVDPRFVRVGNYRVSGGETAMLELLEMKDRPTAIVAANDLTAIGALRVIHREGLSVPQDFSIIGFDDIELSDIVFPPLASRTCRSVCDGVGVVGEGSTRDRETILRQDFASGPKLDRSCTKAEVERGKSGTVMAPLRMARSKVHSLLLHEVHF